MLCAAVDDVEKHVKHVFAYVSMCNFTKTLCLKLYKQCLTVVVEGVLLNAVGARSIHFKYIRGRMDLFPLLDGFVAIPSDANLITFVHNKLNLYPAQE